MSTSSNGVAAQEKRELKKKGYHLYRQIIASLTVNLTMLSSGIGFAWPAVTLPKLLDEASEQHITSDQGAWMVSALPMGACLGPIMSALFVDRIGRKWFIYSCSIPFVICWVSVYFDQSFECLFVTRLIYGIGVGGTFAAVPMYIGEIAEVRIRGAIGSVATLMLSTGSFLVYLIAPLVDDKTLTLMNLVPTILLLVIFPFLPDTPYFYLKKKKVDLAEKSLSWLRKSDEVHEELKEMSTLIETEMKQQGKITELVTVRGNRKATLIMLLLLGGQQFSGMVAILSYITTLLKAAKLEFDANYATIIVSGAAVLSVMVSTCLVDKLGRKPLYLLSAYGTVAGHFTVAIYFYMEHSGIDVHEISWLPLAAVFLINCIFSFGLGPMPYTVLSEIYPTTVKAVATMGASIYGSLLGVIIAKVYQVVVDTWGYEAIFFVLGTGELVLATLVLIIVPETKGRSFREIQELLAGNIVKSETTRF